MQSKRLRLILGVVLAFFGLQLIQLDQKFMDLDDLKIYEDLCGYATRCDAILDDAFTIASGTPVTKYNCTYRYSVSGTTYEGKFTSEIKPTLQSKEIWYDHRNPELSFTENPCNTFQEMKRKPVSSLKNWLFYTGVLLLLGSGWMYVSYFLQWVRAKRSAS